MHNMYNQAIFLNQLDHQYMVPPLSLATRAHLVTVCLIGRSWSKMQWFMVDAILSSSSCNYKKKKGAS